MRASELLLCVGLAGFLAALPGCVGGHASQQDSAQEADKVAFTCELGTWTEEGGFVPFGDDAKLELQMGFQGFLLVAVHARTAEPAFPEGDGTMSMQIEGADTLNGKQPEVAFQDGISEEILVFFTGNYLSYYEGRAANLAVRIEDATRTCLVQVAGTLVDEDPCIHTGADPICPGDTGS